MKYDDVIKNLKDKEKEVEIHYYSGGCKTTYTIDVDGDIDAIPDQTMRKIYKNHDVKERAYAIEGSKEIGWIIVKLSDEQT